MFINARADKTETTRDWRAHGGIRYGALSSQRSHSNAYAVLSPLAATLLMAQTQSIIVTCTGFHVENRVRGDQQNGPWRRHQMPIGGALFNSVDAPIQRPFCW